MLPISFNVEIANLVNWFVTKIRESLIINPVLLLMEVEKGLNRFCDDIRFNSIKRTQFIALLKADFSKNTPTGSFVSKADLKTLKERVKGIT